MHTSSRSSRVALSVVVAALGLASSASAHTVFGLGSGNVLFTFDSSTPGSVSSPLAVSGLGSSSLLGIDIRPADGLLYGVGTGNKVFTIDTLTGAATDVSAASFLGTAPGGGLGSGTIFGVDFNPAANRLRIVSDSDTNLRVFGPSETVDPTLNYRAGDANFGVNPTVTSVAYTNPDTNPGTGTTLYGLDSTLNVLVRHNTGPGFADLETIGALGVDFGAGGFDINISGTAYGSSYETGAGVSKFYTIDLTTGAASLVGNIGSGLHIQDFAVTPVPEPETYAAIAGGMLVAFAAWRRRR